MQKKQDGFTLAEVLIVIVILGITAGLAVPVFNAQVESSRANEATSNLSIIYTAEKIYRLNNNTYYDGGTLATDAGTGLNTDINNLFGTDIPASQFYDLTVNQGDENGFTATATRNNDTQLPVYAIDQTGVMTRDGVPV